MSAGDIQTIKLPKHLAQDLLDDLRELLAVRYATRYADSDGYDNLVLRIETLEAILKEEK
jgi:hypothetical protein